MLNFGKVIEQNGLASILRKDESKLEIASEHHKGFSLEARFNRKFISVQGKYKSRGFEMRMESDGVLRLELRGPGGGVHSCRFGDDMVFRHRLGESAKGDAEKVRLILAMVQRMDGDLTMPSDSLIQTPAICRQPLIDWIHGIHSAIESAIVV